MFVDGKVDFLALNLQLEGRDLVLENTLVVGLLPQLLGTQGKGVHLITRDLVLFGQILRSQRHRKLAERVAQTNPQGILECWVGTERNSETGSSHSVRSLAHVVHSSGQRNLRRTQDDVLSSVHDRLESGSAQAVHSEGRLLDWNSAVQRYVTRQKGTIRGRQHQHLTNVDRVDLVGLNAGSIQGCLCRSSLQLCGIRVLERPSEGAESRTLGSNNKDSWKSNELLQSQ